ncbi:MAG: stimulus-sensing domain-containing protein [Pseudomonadota bacterium]
MLKRAFQTMPGQGPVGLDDRPRPASSRERIIKGLKQSAPFSSLQRRIIFFNLVGLALMVTGITYLSDRSSYLVEVYVGAMHTQSAAIAAGVAEAASVDGEVRPTLDPEATNRALAYLAPTAGARVMLFDLQGRIIADSYRLGGGSAPIVVSDLDPPSEESGPTLSGLIDRLLDQIEGFGAPDPPIFREVAPEGATDEEEVFKALSGQVTQTLRVNSEGELVVSVVIPVRRLHAIVGALRLSSGSGEIERIVREERQTVLEVFFLAAVVSVVLSILLANMIARPIRQLATAARIESTSEARMLNPERPEIPDLTKRSDEIGDLSDALIRMTGALYTRIGAIESFAADVAHEIKNPLTSLRSAVETMEYAKTPEQRQKLLDVIQSDVQRLDRLVTDISNASRLDAELVRERMEPFDLGRLILSLATLTGDQGAALDVTVTTDLPEKRLVARGLEGRLAQVITNLLTNALSFSPRGSTIRVEASVNDETIRMVVMDEGPGIPPENLKSIFERFYSERPETEAFGNHSGLGLSISRQIVEAHDGWIWAENRTDRSGARFIVELPV